MAREQIQEENEMKVYRAEIEDDNFEIIYANNDDEALSEYWELAEQGHEIFNLFELDSHDEPIRTIA